MKFIYVLIAAIALSGCGHVLSDDVIMSTYEKIITANKLPELKSVIIERKDENISASIQYADNTVTLSQGMIEETKNADELAFVIGHELAHRTMGKQTDTYAAELRADKLGMEYAVKAGYNKCAAAQIIWSFEGGVTHPEDDVRYAATGCPK